MSSSYAWLETIPASLLSLEEKPQFSVPSFPWEEFEKGLQQRFEQPNLKLTPREKGWVEKIPFSDKETIIALYAGNLSIPIFWIHRNLDDFVEIFLGSKQDSAYFFQKPVVEGFSQFITLEMMKVIEDLKIEIPFSFYLGDLPNNVEELFKKHPFFEVEILFKFNNLPIATSLFIPPELRSLLKKEHAFSLNEELQKKIDLEVALEVGYSVVDRDEFSDLKMGDFLILDHCSYDPETKEGSVILTLKQENIFRGKLKENGIKILEFPRLEEAKKTMEIEDEEEDVLIDEEVSERSPSIALEKLPLQIVVEVSRIKMTVEELSKLSPGSLIDLAVSPEEGVDLVINGKKIGKGELVKMGDILGVRITKL